ncbi:hypothetical protein [Rhodococcus sp. IEGM 1330]|uniref:hypothetical protein n=1 Tax=Rhodococcus sp. IEGM 1330 TaxID=3082225 RepID=UPI002952D549|nr:hypothetical protein [Rhodococcus sp. IEGM 1330]MDV8023396.1 hypothetical protein [Rhodococcus sp. IEGM 1330]
MSERRYRTAVVSGIEVTLKVVEGHEPASTPIPIVRTAAEDTAARTVQVDVDPMGHGESVVCASPAAADQWDSRMWNNTRHA